MAAAVGRQLPGSDQTAAADHGASGHASPNHGRRGSRARVFGPKHKRVGQLVPPIGDLDHDRRLTISRGRADLPHAIERPPQ